MLWFQANSREAHNGCAPYLQFTIGPDFRVNHDPNSTSAFQLLKASNAVSSDNSLLPATLYTISVPNFASYNPSTQVATANHFSLLDKSSLQYSASLLSEQSIMHITKTTTKTKNSTDTPFDKPKTPLPVSELRLSVSSSSRVKFRPHHSKVCSPTSTQSQSFIASSQTSSCAQPSLIQAKNIVTPSPDHTNSTSLSPHLTFSSTSNTFNCLDKHAASSSLQPGYPQGWKNRNATHGSFERTHLAYQVGSSCPIQQTVI